MCRCWRINLRRLRKLVIVCYLLMAALLLAGCAGEQPEQQASPPPEEECVSTDSAAESVAPVEPAFVFAPGQPLFEFAALGDMPELPPVYAPELVVIPITNQRHYYTKLIRGPVTLIDCDLNRVALPADCTARNYIILSDWYEDKGERYVYGYVLQDEERLIYVDASGRVDADFYAQPVLYGDAEGYECRNGFLIAIREFAEEDAYACGVIDLRSGKELIMPQYDAIELDTATIWAIRDGQQYLFDYAGNLLLQSTDQMDSYERRGSYAGELIWHAQTYRTLYLPTVDKHAGMVTAHTPVVGLSVFGTDGVHLFSLAADELVGYYLDTDKIIALHKDGTVTLLFADGQGRQIMLPPEQSVYKFPLVTYEQDRLVLAYNDGWYRAYNDAGILVDESDSSKLGVKIEYDREKDAYQLLGPDGHVLYPYGAYADYGFHRSYFDESSNFIFAYNPSADFDSDHPFKLDVFHYTLDILNAEGQILLQDVYGVVNNQPVFPGQLVVWLDPTSCVLLDHDGNIEQVPPYITVERSGAP